MQSAESLLYKLLSCRGFCKCKFVLKKKKNAEQKLPLYSRWWSNSEKPRMKTFFYKRFCTELHSKRTALICTLQREKREKTGSQRRDLPKKKSSQNQSLCIQSWCMESHEEMLWKKESYGLYLFMNY